MKRPKLSALIDPTVSKKIRKRRPFSKKKKKIPKHWLPYVVERKRLTDKIIHLQRKVRRMKMKTQKALSKMKTKEKKASCIIKSARSFKPIAKEIFQNELKNACAKKQSYDYSSSIKNFALKVSFHSNGAYEELRKGFTLPSTTTITFLKATTDGVERSPKEEPNCPLPSTQGYSNVPGRISIYSRPCTSRHQQP